MTEPEPTLGPNDFVEVAPGRFKRSGDCTLAQGQAAAAISAEKAALSEEINAMMAMALERHVPIPALVGPQFAPGQRPSVLHEREPPRRRSESATRQWSFLASAGRLTASRQ